MNCNWCGDWRALAPGARAFGRMVAQTANLMVGLPDYDAYVAHRESLHPGQPVMTRTEFFRERQDSRYGGKGRAFRCC